MTGLRFRFLFWASAPDPGPWPVFFTGGSLRDGWWVSKRHVTRYGSTKELVGAAANGGLPAQQLPSLGSAWLVAQGLSGGPAGLFAMQRDLSSPSVTRVIQAG